jgi:hypothetical protein
VRRACETNTNLVSTTLAGQLTNPTHESPQNAFLFTVLSALPTYAVGSFMYQPDPTPSEPVRFTRKHDAIRAIVLFTYGRLYGTPFNLQFLIADYIMSYTAGFVMGEPARHRRSEFLVALLWLVGSTIVETLIPPSMSSLAFLHLAIDRTLWRTAYLALVDDVVNVLSRPNIRTLRGRVTLICVQAFTITFLVWFALSWLRRFNETHPQGVKTV